jgi:hypothetical protein
MNQESGFPMSIAILFAGAILGVSIVAAAILLAVLFAPAV